MTLLLAFLIILEAGNRQLRAVRGVGIKMIDSLTAHGHEAWLAKEKENLEKRQVSFFLGTDSYPPHLNEIYDPPIGLYSRGQIARRTLPKIQSSADF